MYLCFSKYYGKEKWTPFLKVELWATQVLPIYFADFPELGP